MEKDNILSGLSEEQKRAATTTEGNIRLVAGAGSGKTHTFTKRFAYICKVLGVDPLRILAVTFTNKAATEMRERVAQAIDINPELLNIFTFHRLALNICKKHLSEIGYPTVVENGEEHADIVIGSTPVSAMAKELFDSYADEINQLEPEDKQIFISGVIRYTKAIISGKNYTDILLSEDEELSSPLEVVEYEKQKVAVKKQKDSIKRKNQAIRKKIKEDFKKDAAHYLLRQEMKNNDKQADAIKVEHEGPAPTMSWAKKIIKMKISTKVLTFDDLIMFALYLLKNYENVREYWQSQFDYIQVDEFQDTDYEQLEILQILSEKNKGLFTVGDPDQGIYQFRGVKPEIFNELDIHFENLQTIYMEDNYRSAEPVLTAANAIIKLNKNRLKKELKYKSGIEDMEAPLLCVGTEQYTAAQLEFNQIRKMLKAGVKPDDICVLYRDKNCDLTEELVRYLRQTDIPLDCQFKSGAFASTFEDIVLAIMCYRYTEGSANFLGKFIDTFFGLEYVGMFDSTLLDELTLDADSIISFLENLYPKPAEGKKATGQYKKYCESAEDCKKVIRETVDYWNKLSGSEKQNLCSEDAQLGTDDGVADGLHIMTMHKSKGLEFPYVFVHMDNGMSPKITNFSNLDSLEEEVRLAYVAVSRAKNQVYLCYQDDTSLSPFTAQSCLDIKPIHSTAYQLPDDDSLQRNVNWFLNQLDMYFFLNNEGVCQLKTADGILAGFRYVTMSKGSRYYLQVTSADLVSAGVEPPEIMGDAVVMYQDGVIKTFEEMHGTVPVINITDKDDIRKLFSASTVSEVLDKYIG